MGVLSCYLDGQPIDVVPNIPRLFLSVVSISREWSVDSIRGPAS